MEKLILQHFAVGPYQCNYSIIGDPVTRQALIVDPGGDAERILAEVRCLDLNIQSIIHTHAHIDHVLASGEIKRPLLGFICA